MERRPHHETTELRRLLDDERAADGAGHRSQAAWEARIRRESASLDTVLRSITEHADAVAVATVTGAVHRGTLRGVGTDVIAIDTPSGERTLVAIAAVESLRSASDRLDASSGNDSGVTFADHLRFLADERATVRLGLRSGAKETGELAMAGDDVCALRSANGWTYVAIATINDAVEIRR